MTGYLIAEEGPLAGLVVRLEDTDQWLLGRDADEVSIVLEDPMVSRKHAICRLTPEGYSLENLSSVNPITQNGKVVTEPVLLHENDILQIGSTFFRFSEKAPAPTPPTEEEAEDRKDSDLIEDQGELSAVSMHSDEDLRWFLKVTSGPNTGAEFSMTPLSTYMLGKDPNLCDIVFQDLSVSRQHARLSVDAENRVFIEDLESRNGTLVNGEPISEKRQLSSQDLVSLGTTNFLVIDRQEAHETILSSAMPPSFAPSFEGKAPLATVPEKVGAEPPPPKDWKETIIPTKHLVIAGCALLAIGVGIVSTIALFRSEPLPIESVDTSEHIKEALKSFNAVQFSFNPSNGKILLVGHVLTAVDKQELLYKIHNLDFIRSIEDGVVIDEYVWENINALLATNPSWIGVSLYSVSPGKFTLRGYLDSQEELGSLTDYMNLNFPYLDRLENQVVVETNLEMQIHSILFAKGFTGVSFKLSNGDVMLAGQVDQKKESTFEEIVDVMKSLKGVRSVKNFVIFTTADTSRIDLSKDYKISGYSKKDDENQFVVINGKIVSIGESIDGMLITEILPSTVLLQKDGLKFKINYSLQ